MSFLTLKASQEVTGLRSPPSEQKLSEPYLTSTQFDSQSGPFLHRSSWYSFANCGSKLVNYWSQIVDINILEEPQQIRQIFQKMFRQSMNLLEKLCGRFNIWFSMRKEDKEITN